MRLTLVFVAVLLLGTACGSTSPAAPGPSASASGSAGPSVAPTGPPITVPADLAKPVNASDPVDFGGAAPTDGWLRSPHVQLKVIRMRVTDRLEPQEHRPLRITDEQADGRVLLAAPGRKLILAQLDTASESTAGTWNPRRFGEGIEDKAEIRLVVGDRRQVLSPRPTIGTVFVVSAADGVPVRLELADEGTTQQLDLRTGKTQRVANALLYRARTAELDLAYEGSGTVARGGVTKNIAVRIKSRRVTLDAWSPQAGWAKPGRGWLHLSDVTGVSTGFESLDDGKDAKSLGVFFEVQDRQTYTLLLPGGQRIAAVAATHTTNMFGLTPAGYAVVFDVPDTFNTATLHLAPSGPMIAVQNKVKYQSSWTRAPAAKDVPIAFNQ